MPLPSFRMLSIGVGAAVIATGLGLPAPVAVAGGRPVNLAQADDDQPASPAEDPGSAAAQTVRMDRLESTVRALTGKVEQLEFQNRKLTDDLRKMQGDVDFRFQDLERGSNSGRPAPAKRTEVQTPPTSTAGLPQDASGVDPAPLPAPSEAPVRPARRVGDAFDPDANPGAPGAPRPLGTAAPSAPLSGRKDSSLASAAPSAPLDLMKRPGGSPDPDSTENGVVPIQPGTVPADVARPAANPSSVASLVPGGTREEYNADLDLYKQGQYDGAATGLRSFVDKYPRDKMLPDAVYYLGQTYSKLGRHREAAEQYLRLSTDFAAAPRAPDALLRLGMSLNAMGVREQACATYQEVTRRFPAASADVRAGVDRELKRARC